MTLGLAGVPADHLLIWHIDVPSLARRGMNASDEMHRLLSPHGRIADLEIYLSLRAAAVSFVRVQDAKKVRGRSSWQLCPLHLTARPLKVLHDAGYRHNANRRQQQRHLDATQPIHNAALWRSDDYLQEQWFICRRCLR